MERPRPESAKSRLWSPGACESEGRLQGFRLALETAPLTDSRSADLDCECFLAPNPPRPFCDLDGKFGDLSVP